MSAPVKPLLLIAIGTDARGDDALAPLLLRELEAGSKDAAWEEGVELLEDYQLQVEHVTDLIGRGAVLFIDADVSCADPYDFSELRAEQDGSYTSHAMNPGSLLHAYRRVYGVDAPPAFLLRIRGHDFNLGEPLSRPAAANLGEAVRLAETLCRDMELSHWRDLADKRVATE